MAEGGAGLVRMEVRLERQTRLVVLQKPRLQEGGRKLLRGDRLFLRRQGDTDTMNEIKKNLKFFEILQISGYF